jgi:putative redox protein
MAEVQSINIKHTGNMGFDAFQNGHVIKLDSSAESGGQDSGVRPKALILTSLAGCTGMDIVSLLNKMKAAYSDFTISVEGELTEEHPKIYHAIKLVYSIKIDAEEDRVKMQKAVDLSQEKYCGVSAMVKAFANLQIEIKYI